ncbi:MAG: response regulator [Calditrichaeota bacterium]|nr:response regulator [Calditrichota bacterium]RQW07443.1 MAG: response regulator [Calditrichota bacterium]
MGLKVMVLEDDESIRSTLTAFLQKQGYEVLPFSRPDQCSFYHSNKCSCVIGSHCTDIILTDVNMPGQDGIGFIEDQIAKGCRVSRIAVMSGDWQSDAMKKAESLGCKIFHKPFSILSLKDWLEGL